MTYPERRATYKHEPKFIDRMKAEENEKPTPFEQESEAEDVAEAAEKD